MGNWFGSSSSELTIGVKGNHNTNVRVEVPAPNTTTIQTPLQEVMKSAGKAASKAINSGGDILAAPGLWLKNMQENWPTILIAGAIIILCITFLYCALRWHFNQVRYTYNPNNFIDFGKIISSRDIQYQQYQQRQHQQNQQLPNQQPVALSVENLTTNTSPATA